MKDVSVRVARGTRVAKRGGTFTSTLAILLAGIAFVLSAQAAQAAVYNVGPSQTYANIGDVPWESLAAGDTVNIYYRATPYYEKWDIAVVGTQSQPVLIHGVPDGQGNLPIIDGQNATTRPQLNFGSQARGLIAVQMGTSTPPSCHTAYVTIENLEFRNASPPYTFKGHAGDTQSYVNASAAVWIVDGSNITIRNCYVHDCGNGLFTYTADGGSNWSEYITLEGNYISQNGIDGDIYEHNSYCESYMITYQYNRYGPPRGTTQGHAIGTDLKDRSAGCIIRYNWIDGGNRELDLVEAQDSTALWQEPEYEKTYVYGNVFIKEQDAGNNQMVHFGEDGGVRARPKCYFYNNTMVSLRTSTTTAFMENGDGMGFLDCRNNIMYVTAAGNNLQISNSSTDPVNISHNWLKTGYVLVGGSGGTVNDDGTSVTGTSPGFVDEAGQNYNITSGSQCVNAGTSQHPDVPPADYPYYQYVKHQSSQTRPNDGAIDIGAYEYNSGIIQPLSITTVSMPIGQLNVAYSSTLACTGGQYPYTWSIQSGTLPGGLSLAPSSGVISGTPTAAGTSNFTVKVQDSQTSPATATQALSITIQYLPLQISGPAFTRNAPQNVHYSQQLSATNGLAPYTWSVLSGTLPAGLSLSGPTGVISGTATTLGTSNFTIKVQDSQASPATATQAYSITVAAAGTGNMYWVAVSGGLDTNNGAWDHPWATIQHAIDTIANGETILVSPGTYAGFRITNSGASGSAKTVMSETAGAAKLNHPVAGALHNAVVEAENTSNPVSYWTIDGFSIDGVNKTYAALNFNYTNHVSVINCVAFQSSTTGFYAPFSDYTLFQNNTIYNCNGSGIYALSSCDNGTLRGNYIHDNTSCGFKLHGVSGAGDGIMSNWLAEKNIIVNCTIAFDLDSVQSSNFKNNLMYGITSKAFQMTCVDGVVMPNAIRALNNTSLNTNAAYYNVFIFNEYAHPAATGLAFYNNIFYNYNNAVNRGSYCIDTAIDSNFVSDYNVVMDGFGFDDNSTYCNFATWKATHNHDTHSLQAADTALFVSPAGNDFHLKAGSPALNAGTTLADCTDDINGVSRPQGTAYDIGCYEAASGALSITTAALPADTVNAAYNQTLQATGGTAPYTWSIQSGSLPAGLSLVSGTGAITGTPTASGTSNFTAKVTDSVSATATRALSIVINAVPSITTSSLPNGQLTIAYNQTLAASGGTSPLTWSLQSGSLPAGLSLNGATGAITGTPTATGTSNFTAKVTDTVGASASKALSIIVTGATLTITTASLPADTVGIAYNQTLTAAGGSTPYTWAIQSGSLPAGLSLVAATGAITGTPTTSGTSSFTARVTDNVAATATQALSIAINAAPSITTASLPNGTTGVAYNQTLASTGGTAPLTWSISSGSLPTGLSLVAGTGAITGTPTAGGTSNFTAKVTDNVGATATKALSIVVISPLSITTTSLPNGTVTIAYSQTLQATGGTTPYTWAISSGSLPAGLSLAASTGVISGTPTATGTSSFTTQVTDNTSATATKALSIIVNSVSGDPTYWQASSDTQTQTTSTTYVTKATLTFTPTAVDDYIIIGYAEHSSAGYGSSKARMTVDAAVEGEQPRRTRGNDWFPLCAVKVATLSAAAHTVTIDYCTTGTDAVSIRKARIVVIRKATLEWSTIASDNSQTVTTTPTTFATLNFTPSSAGDYLLIYGAEILTQYGNTAAMSALLDGATVQSCPMQSKGLEGEASPLATFSMATLTAAQHAMTIQASMTTGSSSIRRCRMAGVRLTGGRFANYAYTSDDTESTTTSTTLVEKLSKTWTPAPTGNWLALFSASTSQSAIWYNCYAQMQFNAATVSENAQIIMDTTEYLSAAGVGVVNVTGGSNKLASDYCSNAGTYAAKIKYVHLAMLPLDSGGTPLSITTTSLPADTAGVAYNQTLSATGGTTPYTWSLQTGSLPAGLSLVASTGAITGTPATSGTSSFTVKVTDNVSATASQALSIVINTAVSITTASLPADTIGIAYPSTTLGATGGTGALTWTVSSGSLPAGLTLVAATGAITGTPTAAGAPNFTATATDTVGATGTKALSITINAAVTITTASLPADTINIAYNQTMAATGGTGALAWSISSGSLPAGLSLVSGTGAITGTPTTSGTSSFTATATDTVGANGTKALSIVINAAVTITTASLPADTVSIAYNQTLAATGGTGALTWSLQSGSLPAGLSLVGGTGAITGTPTASGTSSFTAKATDTVGASGTRALSIVINAAPSITTSSLPNGSLGVAYNQTMAASGGTTPLAWAISSGSLPGGLSLVASTGAITGTPTASGTSNFTARVTDNVGATATKALSIVVVSGLTITTTTLPATTVGATYNQTLVATGGVTPYTWAISSGSLPAGLSLVASTGAITGTPTASGTSNFTARVTDNVAATATQALSIVVNAAVTITTASLPADTVGIAYNQTLAATGGTGALSWSIQSGTLPAGLSLVSGTGAITGTPATSGTSSFTAMATDTVGATGTKALSIVINAAVTITTASLPADTINIAYNQTLAATGGTAPLTWAISGGTLPAGLSLVAATGAITGTPTASGTSSFTARAADAVGASGTKALSIVINSGVSITTSSLPAGTVGTAYSQTLASTGGTSPYTWSIQSGSLPAGLSLVGSTGAITGTPTATGTSNFTAKVTDNVSATATQALSMTINASAEPTYQFVASDTEATTTSTAYVNKTTLTFTPGMSDSWVILGFAEAKESSTTYAAGVQLTVDGTVAQDTTLRPKNATDYQSFVGMKVVTLSAASHTINIDYKSSSASGTAYIRNARIVAIRQASLILASADQGDTASNLTTTMTNYISTSFTPATAGDYLLVWSTAMNSATTSYATNIEARLNGVAQDTASVRTNNTVNWATFVSFQVASNLPASAQTISLAAAKAGGSAVQQVKRSRVAAIRLTGGRYASYQTNSSDTESTTTSTTFQNKLTKSWTPGAAGNWAILTSFRMTNSSTSYSTEAQVTVDDSTTSAQPIKRIQNATDYLPMGSVDVRNLTAASHHMDVNYRSANGSGTAKIKYVRFVGLPL